MTPRNACKIGHPRMQDGELRLAMIAARVFWSGTSITDGAFAIMEQVRQASPEQFKTDDQSNK